MTKTVQRLGDPDGLALTPAMKNYLGVSDEVEVALDDGKIIITAPSQRRPGRRMAFAEAMESTFEQYGGTMRDLAGIEGK